MSQAKTKTTVVGVFAHQDQDTVANHFVVLRDDRKRRGPIFIGQFEAFAISMAVEGQTPDRPFTHDTMLNLLTLSGGVVEEAFIKICATKRFMRSAA